MHIFLKIQMNRFLPALQNVNPYRDASYQVGINDIAS